MIDINKKKKICELIYFNKIQCSFGLFKKLNPKN